MAAVILLALVLMSLILVGVWLGIAGMDWFLPHEPGRQESAASGIGLAIWSCLAGFLALSAAAWLFVLRPRQTQAERRLTEQALCESERRYRELVAQAKSAIFRLTPDGVVTFINPYAQTLFGWTGEELLGQPAHCLVPERETTGVDLSGLVEDFLAHPDDYACHFNENLCRDGRRVWMLWTNYAVRDDQGQVCEFVSIGNDVTELKRMEEAQLASEQRFRALVMASCDVLYRMSPDWSEMRQLQSQTFLSNTDQPRRDWLHAYIPPEDQPQVWAAIQEAIRAKRLFELEHRIRRADGGWGWTLSRAVPLLGADGEIREWFGAAKDVTASKQAEQRLRMSEARLHALAARLQAAREEERSRLAREVHDVLGQRLTALTMDIAWMHRRIQKRDDAAFGPGFADKLDEMAALTQSMIRSVQELTSELRPAALDHLGLGAAIEFEACRFARRTDIHCRLDVPSEHPDLAPDIATGVFRVFQELLTNIARHAGARHVDIRLAWADAALVLEIADDGCGIPPDRLGDIGSMGVLGMRERAAQMGGELTFEAPPGQGTQVRLHVPL